LRDYPYLLASTTDASTKIEEETTRRQKSNEVQTATLRDTQAQIAERTKLTAALESDQKNLRTDQQVVTEVLETKTSAVEQLIQKIDGIQSQLNAISR
jgi:septal ring factor EnvC (AmiA/AmiB activator)